MPSVAPPESIEEIASPADTPMHPASVATTPRRSTAESTEQEMSSEDEEETEIQVEPFPSLPTSTKGIYCKMEDVLISESVENFSGNKSFFNFFFSR